MRAALVVSLVALLQTPFATAQPVCAGDDVDALLTQGVQLRRARNPEGARMCFEAALRRADSARALGQLGFAEQELHRWEGAATHLRRSLARRDDPWVAQNLEALQNSLAEVERELAQRPSPALPPPPAALPPPPSQPPLQRALSPLLWVGGGLAVAAAAAAVGVGLSGRELEADYDSRCVDRAPDGSTDCRALQRETQATLDERALAVNALWGVTALGVGVAVTGVLLSLRSGARASSPRSLSAAVGPRGVAVAVAW